MKDWVEYAVEQTVNVLSIDSPSGFTARAAAYVMEEYRRLGYQPELTNKGGVVVCVSQGTQLQEKERPETGAVFLEAHLDTLGAMVREVSDQGRLRLTPIGGMNPNNAEAENCRVYTRGGKVFTGTFQMQNASIHFNKAYNATERSYKTMEVVLDQLVEGRQDILNLGIRCGDFVCFDPRTEVTESGFIKSRFLDDKLSVGILLAHAKYLRDSGIKTPRRIYHHITVFEEVGHGGASSVPSDVTEAIAVDMGCVGDGLLCKETQVSICAKDSGGPYHYDVVTGLVRAAERAGVDFVVDVYPDYASDVEVTLRAGWDIRHGLIGSGVYASHGYERSHKKGVENTLALLRAYLG